MRRVVRGRTGMALRTVNPTPAARRENDRAELALAAAGLGEFEWDMQDKSLWVSPRLHELAGWPLGRHPAQPGAFPLDRLSADDRAALGRAIEEAIASNLPLVQRVRLRGSADRAEQWIEVRGLIQRDWTGAPERIVGVVRDISSEKGEADQLRGLVAELDHRVKNVLAAVQSLAAQSARRTTSLEAFLKTFSGRLQAMAAAHTLLTATRWRGVEISHIAAAELGGLAQGQARWSGPDIVLNPRATHALTLALHELGANAVKYGALSTESGRIEVSWRSRADGGFDLEWTEHGGPIVTAPTRGGFGSTLLERVTGHELGGSVTQDFRPEGLRVVITADASAIAAREAANETVETSTPSPAAAEAGVRRAPAENDLRGIRVLIVEDAVLLALELEAGLTESGARVVGVAADLEEAMRLAALDFDVAILDANLGGKAVTPVACALTARGVPFIVATGYGESASAPAGFHAPVVRKPFNVDQIAEALKLALGRP
jgi:two-component sensor histidine kinase